MILNKKLWLRIALILTALSFSFCDDNDAVEDTFGTYFEWKLSLNPLRASSHGKRDYDTELPSRAQRKIREVKNKCRFFLRRGRNLLRKGKGTPR